MSVTQTARIAVTALLFSVVAACSGKPNYKLTQDQINQLKLAQKDALIIQMQVNQVQAALQEKLKVFQEECVKIKSQNNLPDSATCDLNNPGVVTPPPTSAPVAAGDKKK